MNAPQKTIFAAALLGLLIAGALPAFAGRPACPEHYFQGISPDITNPKMMKDFRELCFDGFGVMHSGITRTPLWSAEHLTRDALSSAEGLVRVNSFHPEGRLPAGSRAELRDYARSGYDRGHMAPNGDMPDKPSQHESFSLANIVPQDPESNRGIWQKIESSVRTLAKKRGELFVLTGPLFRGAQLKRIGERVMVPSHLYKIVLDPKNGRAGAYLVENAPTSEYATMSIAELESIAGIDFFPGMPASVKKAKPDLPKPSRNRGRGRKRAPPDDDPDALVRGLKSLFR
ncbi:MAG TPA: DNA/RNA non-specific endonuclease [Candidatus Deferrimicrobiaceae bacterium]|jgi:endonuclease G